MAHLHALLAAESSAAVLIKRGPGKVSCTIGWDRRTDTFETGQWLKQKLEHEAADLSPDGKLLVYFINTQRWSQPNSCYRAISRAPWLKALSFWGTDSWVSGPGPGLFIQNEHGRLQLHALPMESEYDHLNIPVVRDLPPGEPWRSMAKDSQYLVRLQRDGWLAVTPFEKCSAQEAAGITEWKQRHPERIILEKPLLYGWRLRLTHWCGLHDDSNRPLSFDTYALIAPDGTITHQPGWEWAEFDAPRKRMVWTEGCILSQALLSRSGMEISRTLFDTNQIQFERVQAPY